MPAVRLTCLPGSLQIDGVHPHLVPSLIVHAGWSSCYHGDSKSSSHDAACHPAVRRQGHWGLARFDPCAVSLPEGMP